VKLALALAALTACRAAAGGPDGADGPDAAVAADAGAPPDAAAPTTFAGTLRGRVSAAGAPLAGATVSFAGRPEHAVSAADGSFTLRVEAPPVVLGERALAAGKPGYWNRGMRVRDPGAEQVLELEPITLVDDPGYAFKSPDAHDATPNCRHCHRRQYADWRGSAHAGSATDPMLADLYNGSASGVTDAAACAARGGAWRPGAGTILKCYLGAGVLPDLNPGRCGGPAQPSCDDPDAPADARPRDTSVCAACHAPVLVAQTGGTDLNAATGVARDAGVSCDFCHKIARVEVGARPGMLGAITLLRPAPADGFSSPEVTFGPWSDSVAFFMGSTVAPEFRRSELCSACHQWSEPGFRAEDRARIDRDKWPDGLPLQDTYAEWLGSSWAARGVECQHCHMPASTATNAVDDEHHLPPSTAGIVGFERGYGELRRHSFAARLPDEPGWTPPAGEPERALLRDPLDLRVEARVVDGALRVEVRLENLGAGHAIPSGTPSRALLLVVGASLDGVALPAVGGQTLPEWVGAYDAATVGTEVSVDGQALRRVAGAWARDVSAGRVVRVVRATGAFADDPGTGWFGRPERTPADKGLAIAAPVGAARVLAVEGDALRLDAPLAAAAGDRVLIGDAEPGEPSVDDALPGRALAGASGWAFGKLMLAADGTRGVPFFEAVDLAADNRLPAGASVTTSHRFAAPPAGRAADVRVTVVVLYRRHPFGQAHLRGWSAVDVVRMVRRVGLSSRP
jgi:hypothetical protein